MSMHAKCTSYTSFLALAVGVSCTASSSEVAPPQFNPYFPSALAVAPEEKYLVVLNSNADLRFDSGTLQVLDLDKVDAKVAKWRGGFADGCSPHPLATFMLRCDTSKGGIAADFLVPGASVKVGNFGSSVAVQPLFGEDGAVSGKHRIIATVRGDPSITWADFDLQSGTMDCGEAGSFPRCSESHRLDRFERNQDLVLSPEPFDLLVNPQSGHLVVTHLTTGDVTLGFSPRNAGLPPVLVDRFALHPSGGRAVGVAARRPGDARTPVYVTSMASPSLSRITPLHVAGGDGTAGQRLTTGTPIMYGDARGIAFSPDGNRAFFVNRSPAEVVALDTSLGEGGVPRNQVIGTVEICERAQALAVADFGDGLRGIVPCFELGEAWVLDLENLELRATALVGLGPSGVAVATNRKRAYVANYAEDTISVMDMDPQSPTENHAVLRVGNERLRDQE
ncbi:MAG: YncE family protein [Deltaproteobacteria bacterium]|nr:YncE family protein [Deltaproteobacteria bacterium]